MEQLAFGLLAQAYPHGAYEYDPERFWEYFHSECPNVPREEMESILAAGKQ